MAGDKDCPVYEISYNQNHHYRDNYYDYHINETCLYYHYYQLVSSDHLEKKITPWAVHFLLSLLNLNHDQKLKPDFQRQKILQSY